MPLIDTVRELTRVRAQMVYTRHECNLNPYLKKKLKPVGFDKDGRYQVELWHKNHDLWMQYKRAGKLYKEPPCFS